MSSAPSRTELHRAFTARPFRPAPWLRGAHAQTVGGKFLRPHPDPGLVRLRVDTPDGDFLDLDLAPEPTAAPDEPAPLALILHGLEGSTARGYVRVAMRELLARGVRPIGMNFRSCSGVPNLRPRFYHSGETGDLIHVLALLRERFPNRRIGALGFSLGGNVLLKYLGDRGDSTGGEGDTPLAAAATISVPFDLTEGTRAIESGLMGKVYSFYFLRSLQRKTRAKERLLAPLVEVERVLAARTLREFDDAATAPLHGFPGAAEYYRLASSGPLLERVRTPTLLVQAEDDPFLPARHLPREPIRRNPWLFPSFTGTGGHVGFVEGIHPGRASFWAEEEAARYLAAQLLRLDPET